jgi:hypothetical protein
MILTRVYLYEIKKPIARERVHLQNEHVLLNDQWVIEAIRK